MNLIIYDIDDLDIVFIIRRIRKKKLQKENVTVFIYHFYAVRQILVICTSCFYDINSQNNM